MTQIKAIKAAVTPTDAARQYGASSKEIYETYQMWCAENALTQLKPRSVSDFLVENEKKYNLEHTNTITNSTGRRVWGFLGIEILARPSMNSNVW